MSDQPALDLTATVMTPENIEFQYRVAGPFQRFPAFLFDLVTRAGTMWFLLMLLTFAGLGGFISIAGPIGAVLLLIGYFLFDWFYGLFFETIWGGKTPGKRIVGIRVISIDGRPISAYQATIRNFLRLGDFAPFASLQIFDPDAPPIYWIPTGAVAILCMLCTRRMQRLGDIAAGTMVIIDERKWIPPKLKLNDPNIDRIVSDLSPSFRLTRSMMRAIALFVERRGRLSAVRRRELAAILANEMLEKAGLPKSTDPDLFLCALYRREYDSQWSSNAKSNTTVSKFDRDADARNGAKP